MMPAARARRGFTVLEMIFVLAAVAIVMLVLAPTYKSLHKKTRDAKRVSDMETFVRIMEIARPNAADYLGEGDTQGRHMSPRCASDIRSDLIAGGFLDEVMADPRDRETACNDHAASAYFYGWDSVRCCGRQWCVSVNRLETQWGRDMLLQRFGQLKMTDEGCNANICNAEFNFCFKMG